MSFYDAVTAVTLIAQVSLGFNIFENGRLPQKSKNACIWAVVSLFIATALDWIAITVIGVGSFDKNVVLWVKCFNHILTPVSLVLMAYPISKHSLTRAMMIIQCFNALFQVVSVWTGWCFYMDASGYHHGSFYWIYLVFTFIAGAFLFAKMVEYGRKHVRRNAGTLIGIIVVSLFAAIMQIINNDLHVINLAFTMSFALFMLRYNEFEQQNMSVKISEGRHERELLRKKSYTDPLTGLENQRAFFDQLSYFDENGMPDKVIFASLDVNGLKMVNDAFGHDVGNDLIRGAADAMKATFGRAGRCFRVGGDEFAFIGELERAEMERLCKKFEEELANWSHPELDGLTVSYGFACRCENPEEDAGGLEALADKCMYECKSNYYKISGHDRRSH